MIYKRIISKRSFIQKSSFFKGFRRWITSCWRCSRSSSLQAPTMRGQECVSHNMTTELGPRLKTLTGPVSPSLPAMWRNNQPIHWSQDIRQQLHVSMCYNICLSLCLPAQRLEDIRAVVTMVHAHTHTHTMQSNFAKQSACRSSYQSLMLTDLWRNNQQRRGSAALLALTQTRVSAQV